MVRDRGSPVGVVTVEDILEQVIGRIEDEYPQHPRVALRDLLLTDDALLNRPSQSVEQAIAELTARIPVERLPPQANIAELTIAREREIPSHVGMGVAIPHVRCPKFPPLAVFGLSTEGYVFEGESPGRVHQVFLLITPAEQSDLQVLLLSQVARLAGAPETRRRLREVASASEVSEILATSDAESFSPATRRSKGQRSLVENNR